MLRSFPRNLDQSTVNVAQIRRLVQKLKDKKLGAAPASPVKRVAAEAEEAEAEVEELDLQAEEPVDLNDPNLDLNKVSITALKAAKVRTTRLSPLRVFLDVSTSMCEIRPGLQSYDSRLHPN